MSKSIAERIEALEDLVTMQGVGRVLPKDISPWKDMAHAPHDETIVVWGTVDGDEEVALARWRDGYDRVEYEEVGDGLYRKVTRKTEGSWETSNFGHGYSYGFKPRGWHFAAKPPAQEARNG